MITVFKVNDITASINPVSGKLFKNNTVAIGNGTYQYAENIFASGVSYHQSYYAAKDQLLKGLNERRDKVQSELDVLDNQIEYVKINY